jgi:hypothetical protein
MLKLPDQKQGTLMRRVSQPKFVMEHLITKISEGCFKPGIAKRPSGGLLSPQVQFQGTFVRVNLQDGL